MLFIQEAQECQFERLVCMVQNAGSCSSVATKKAVIPATFFSVGVSEELNIKSPSMPPLQLAHNAVVGSETYVCSAQEVGTQK